MAQGDIHTHKCYLCGTMWTHVQDFTVSSEKYHAAHDCPNKACGANQRWIYMEEGEKEKYPGFFEARHVAWNKDLPGGGAGGRKGEDLTKEIDDEIMWLVLRKRRYV